jgi:hypothetical protein
MAKVVEVTVFKPAPGKLDDYLSVAKEFKAYVLKAGVEEVWFNTGSVGRHFGCVVGYQVFASGEASGRIADKLETDKDFANLQNKMNSLGEFISRDNYYQTQI